MKTNNPFLPKFDLVVTRHAPLVEWLLREGYIDADTPVVAHAHADRVPVKVTDRTDRAPGLLQWVVGLPGRSPQWFDCETEAQAFADAHNAANVRGRHVIGVLPHHLSSQAASITEVQLDWAPQDRAAMQHADVDVEAVARAARGLHTYRVVKSDASARQAEAFAEALRIAPVCQDAPAIKFLTNEHAAIIEVSDPHGHKTVQVDLYKGALREDKGDLKFGPWRCPLTGEPWKMAVRRRAEDGGRGELELVGGYGTDGIDRRIARRGHGLVDAIIADLNDRRGLGLDTIDEEIRAEIRERWIELARATPGTTPRVARAVHGPI